MMQRSLQEQMDAIIKDYPDKVDKLVDEVAGRVALQTVQTLKRTSPKRSGKGGGKYARGWKVKPSPGLLHGTIVYNTQYQLTHLLENGHVIANQYGTYGRVSGQKHIEPAEKAGMMQYELQIRAAISRGLT